MSLENFTRNLEVVNGNWQWKPDQNDYIKNKKRIDGAINILEKEEGTTDLQNEFNFLYVQGALDSLQEAREEFLIEKKTWKGWFKWLFSVIRHGDRRIDDLYNRFIACEINQEIKEDIVLCKEEQRLSQAKGCFQSYPVDEEFKNLKNRYLYQEGETRPEDVKKFRRSYNRLIERLPERWLFDKIFGEVKEELMEKMDRVAVEMQNYIDAVKPKLDDNDVDRAHCEYLIEKYEMFLKSRPKKEHTFTVQMRWLEEILAIQEEHPQTVRDIITPLRDHVPAQKINEAIEDLLDIPLKDALTKIDLPNINPIYWEEAVRKVADVHLKDKYEKDMKSA